MCLLRSLTLGRPYIQKSHIINMIYRVHNFTLLFTIILYNIDLLPLTNEKKYFYLAFYKHNVLYLSRISLNAVLFITLSSPDEGDFFSQWKYILFLNSLFITVLEHLNRLLL